MAAIKRPFNSWCQQEPIRPSKRIVNHEISTCMHLDLSRFLDPSVISEQGELALVPRLGYFSSTSMTSCCPFLKEIRFWSVHKSQHGVVKCYSFRLCTSHSRKEVPLIFCFEFLCCSLKAVCFQESA
jgi:hypothetical protein